jgi:hypothetical protein
MFFLLLVKFLLSCGGKRITDKELYNRKKFAVPGSIFEAERLD